MKELARREALAVWMAAIRDALGAVINEREVELRFDAWWSKTSRRELQGRGRR